MMTIARIPLWKVFKAGWTFTGVLALVTLLVTYVLWFSLALGNLVKW
jgi:TRAP-type C4-dicarboxylate transport system permease large subunit